MAFRKDGRDTRILTEKLNHEKSFNIAMGIVAWDEHVSNAKI